jgi:tetratricopeptide (TPR) repeat protein
MAELARLEFLYERSEAGEPVYVFKHALTQDVARSTLIAPRRRALHRRAAEALQALDPERVRELAPVLAYHFQEAEAWSEAAHHARVAAESARQVFANQEALVRFDQALAAVERTGGGRGEEVELLKARAQVHEILGDFEHARADLETALGRADARGDTLARGRESLAELEAASRLFEELGDEVGQAKTLDMLGMRSVLAGEFERGMTEAEEAARRLHALGDRVTESASLINLAFGHGYRDGWRAAEPFIRRALDLALSSGARAAEAFARAALAQLALPSGLYGLAWQEAETALAVARAIDHREWTAMALSMLGRARLGVGDAAGALRLHEEMREIAERLGTNIWIAEARSNLGEDLIALGRAPEADAMLAAADASIRLEAGDARGALAMTRDAATRATWMQVFVGEARRVEAEALAVIEGPDAAVPLLAEVEALAERIGAAPLRWRTALALARLLGAAGRREESRAAAARALAALESVARELDDADRARFEASDPMVRARAALSRRIPA